MNNIIFVIEDHQELNDIITIRLKASGFEVIQCLDGTSAFEKIKQKHPVLIILDIDLPDINGLDLLAKIRKTPGIEETKVLILTGLTDSTEDGVANGKLKDKLGVSEYISKPFATEDLVQEVKKLIQ